MPDGRTILFGLPGVGVRYVEHVAHQIAHAAFTVHAEALLRQPAAVTVLGIDETRRGRPRWTRCEQRGQTGPGV